MLTWKAGIASNTADSLLATSGKFLTATFHRCMLLRYCRFRCLLYRLSHCSLSRPFACSYTSSSLSLCDPTFSSVLDFLVSLGRHFRDAFCLTYIRVVSFNGEWRLRFLGHFALILLKLKLIQVPSLELVTLGDLRRHFRRRILITLRLPEWT